MEGLSGATAMWVEAYDDGNETLCRFEPIETLAQKRQRIFKRGRKDSRSRSRTSFFEQQCQAMGVKRLGVPQPTNGYNYPKSEVALADDPGRVTNLIIQLQNDFGSKRH